MKKIFTLVCAAMMAASVNAQSAETLYFGGAGTSATLKLHDGSALPELYKGTAQYGAISILGGKASISGDEYKGVKILFSDFKPVGENGINVVIGVKGPNYSKDYKCDPIQYAGLYGDEELVVNFKEDFKGKNIDLLDIQALAPGVEILLKKVCLVKQDGTEEEITPAVSWGWQKSVVGKTAYTDPVIVFPSQWSLITVSTDEDGTLATYDVYAADGTTQSDAIQTYTVEFEEPTTAGLNLGYNTDVKDETVTWDAKIADYFPVEVGSTKASFSITAERVLSKTDKAKKVINVFLQNTDAKSQTVKIKSITRVLASTGIANVETMKGKTGQKYNLAGQKVGDDYKGVVIMKGRKMVNK